MLGRTISDPHGVENENSLREPLYPAHCEAISHEPDTIAVERIRRDGALPLRGMELIDTDTTLMPEKMRTQTRGKFENVTGIFSTLSGLEFSGYEIHMGKTTVSTGEHQTPLVQLADGRTDGVQRMEKGSEAPGVYGSYVHGIFDDGDIAVRIVQALADKKGYHGNRRQAAITMHLRNSSMTSSHRDCGSIWIWSMYTLFCRRVGFPLDFYNVIDPDTNQDNG